MAELGLRQGHLVDMKNRSHLPLYGRVEESWECVGDAVVCDVEWTVALREMVQGKVAIPWWAAL